MKTKYTKTLNMITELKETGLKVFTSSDLQKIFDLTKKQTYNLINSLTKKKVLTRIKKYYLFSWEGFDLKEIATQLVWPSYISLWTALNYYGFTEQVPGVLTLCTTKPTKKVKINNFLIEYIHIKPNRFFGYQKLGSYLIANKEKTLIDSLLYPQHISLKETIKCLHNAWPEINQETLIKYALRVKNISLIKRLGFLIEELNLKCEPALIKKLEKKAKRPYVKLDPLFKKTREYNSKWKIIKNVKNLEEFKEVF